MNTLIAHIAALATLAADHKGLERSPDLWFNKFMHLNMDLIERALIERPDLIEFVCDQMLQRYCLRLLGLPRLVDCYCNMAAANGRIETERQREYKKAALMALDRLKITDQEVLEVDGFEHMTREAIRKWHPSSCGIADHHWSKLLIQIARKRLGL